MNKIGVIEYRNWIGVVEYMRTTQESHEMDSIGFVDKVKSMD